MKIPEELIDHLEQEINIGNVDKKVQNIISLLAEQNKRYKEVIDKAIELLNNPWSIESGNKELDEITYKKKREVIDLLKEVDQ